MPDGLLSFNRTVLTLPGLGFLEGLEDVFNLPLDLIIEVASLVDVVQQLGVLADSYGDPARLAHHFGDFDVVQVTAFCGKQHQRLLCSRHRRILFHCSARSLSDRGSSCCRIASSDRRRTGERSQFTILRQRGTDTTGRFFMILVCAAPPTRDAGIPGLTAGRYWVGKVGSGDPDPDNGFCRLDQARERRRLDSDLAGKPVR